MATSTTRTSKRCAPPWPAARPRRSPSSRIEDAIMSVDRLVVVGASLAGLRAVEAARRAGFTGSVTLIGDEPHLPYDRPPLSKAVLEPDTAVDAPTFRSLDTLHREMRVDLRL